MSIGIKIPKDDRLRGYFIGVRRGYFPKAPMIKNAGNEVISFLEQAPTYLHYFYF
jgi:hypothetical protein